MATVWASRVGGTWSPANGWTHCLGFWTLDNLISQMEKEGLRGISKLGIIAHGDRGGLVQLDRDLTPETVHTFSSEFKKLRYYLTPNARLVFFSCIAAQGIEGDKLLSALSKLLPGREVAGFIVFGWMPPGTKGELGGVPSPAGAFYEAGGTLFKRAEDYRGQKLVNEWHETTKWARDGWIVRPPRFEVLSEQTKKGKKGELLNSQKRCGSIFCPGHREYGHWCKDYTRHPVLKFITNPLPAPVYRDPSLPKEKVHKRKVRAGRRLGRSKGGAF
jgi:hypothetical protein